MIRRDVVLGNLFTVWEESLSSYPTQIGLDHAIWLLCCKTRT